MADISQADDFRVQTRRKIDKVQSQVHKMWDIIAQRPSDFDMQVIDALKSTITTDNNNQQPTYTCYGEDLYFKNIRDKLIKYNLLLNDTNTNDKHINDKHINDKHINDKHIKDKHNPTKDNTTKDKTIISKSKADIIREASTIQKLEERILIIIKSFNLVNFTIPSETVITSNILEIRALGFIYLCWFVYTHKDKYSDKKIPFSIIVSLQRFINIIATATAQQQQPDLYCGNNAMNMLYTINISKTLVADLKHIETKLIKLYAFNGITLYEQASELILGSPYDKYLPRKAIDPFNHQKKISDILMNFEMLKSGFMMFYRTMTNSGKTSTIINMVMAVQELRKKYPSVFGNLQVIATCDVQPVIMRWGQLLYHAGFPFAIGAKRMYPTNPELINRIKIKAQREQERDLDCVDINMRFSNSDACTTDLSNRLAIICPTEIALKILANAKGAPTRFILLHDEPTMYASDEKSEHLRTNMSVFKNAPKWSIFSSATLPLPADATSQPFIQHHKTKFPTAEFIDNYSTEIYGCCNVQTFEGTMIVPHLGCETRDELVNAISHIETNPFLGKLYTPTSIKLLYDEAQEAHKLGNKNIPFMSKLPNITEIFSKVSNLYPDNIRKVALDILRAITLLDDKRIKYICSMEYEDDDDESDDENESYRDDDDENESYRDDRNARDIFNNAFSIDAFTDAFFNVLEDTDASTLFKHLGTTDAHKYPYLNLIASTTPMEFMKTNYDELVIDIKKNIGGSLSKLESEYEKKFNKWQEQYDGLEKTYKNLDELSREQSNLNDCKPQMVFPAECQINTKQHYDKYKYTTNELKPTNTNTNTTNTNINYRNPNSLTNHKDFDINDFHITDDMKLQLLSGVCCYTPPDASSDIDPSYLDSALELTSKKQVETIIADNSICYGTDYPIGGIIITKEFSDKNTLNTIYQLMSRAGRGRKSNSAEIHINMTCAKQILDTIKQGHTNVSLEVVNMCNVFNSCA